MVMPKTDGKNAVEQNIISRRTIKSFKKDSVSSEVIIELLEVAKWAPNHKLTEPWRFRLYIDGGKEEFVQAYIASQPLVDGEVSERVKKKAQYFNRLGRSLLPQHLKDVGGR
jgi:nitroreductase